MGVSDNLALRRDKVEADRARTGIDMRTGIISFGSDVIEALAIALINAEKNSELRRRVTDAFRGVGDENNVPESTRDDTPGNPALITGLDTGAVPFQKIVSKVTAPDWVRKDIAIKARATNTGIVQIARVIANSVHFWELTPNEGITIPCNNVTEIFAKGSIAAQDVNTLPFGAGTIPPVDTGA